MLGCYPKVTYCTAWV